MRQHTTDDATEGQHPIDSGIVDEVAYQYAVDRNALDDALAAANDALVEISDELREYHEVISDDDPLIVLASHGTEWEPIESRIDHNLTPPKSPALVMSVAHDRQAKHEEFSAFGGRDKASSAIGYADAVIVDTEDN